MATSDGSTENPENSVFLLRWPCEHDDASYTSLITKPPEGLGVRLVSAGPLFFFRCIAALGLLLSPGCGAGAPRRVELFPGVVTLPEAQSVELSARVACTRGDLEQVACTQGTREHESLLVAQARASQVQAALLAAGLRPGAPGRWQRLADGSVERVPPTGDAIEVLVRTEPGGPDQPIESWMRGADGGTPQPMRFVFAGSRFVPARGGGERFLADDSGSLVGLVTFGDEVVGLAEVVPDRVEVEPSRWKARTGAMPAQDTPVTLVMRRRP